ncbi:MAG TPA: RidA family protein [Candidatus Faecousia excrementigallinarum]|uniref:RidA family protein n=1 Tax=Candidatus Faecousia excrementigallinarum TaxID=2840806 RepID=A0A9D0Z3V3_9FIRM|nr:RidA family protein [Candidatus Faecousia excrementigallinarum]
MKEKIETQKAPAAIGPYAQGVMVEGFLFASGQLPVNPDTGLLAGATIEEQAEQSMKNVGAVLEAAGMTYENVVKTTCFLSDMGNFAAFNEVYGRYFTGKPARSCVAVREIPKGALCEVEVIAHK